WSQEEWVADVVPHLVYGAVTDSVLRALDRPRWPGLPPTPTHPAARRARHVLPRALVLGLATGGRSTAGVAALAAASPRRPGLLGALGSGPGHALTRLSWAGEVVADKLPETPSRLGAPQLGVRLGA